MADIEPHDAWPDPLDDLCHGARIGVEERGVAARVTFEWVIFKPIHAGNGGRARTGFRVIEHERKGKIAILVHAER
jgi:hypothetical protein